MNPFPKYLELSDRKCTALHLNRPNRLIIFGDSFAETRLEGEIGTADMWKDSWTLHLASMLNASILNWALSGSSLNYSMQNLFFYLKHHYNDTDIIVFVTTSYGRLPATEEHMSPKIQANFKNYLAGDHEHIEPEVLKHFHKMKDTYSFLTEYLCVREDFINQVKMLDAYLNTLPNKTVLIPGFNEISEKSLYNLSMSEPNLGHHVLKDKRCNHFNKENNKHLAKQIHWHLQGNELRF